METVDNKYISRINLRSSLSRTIWKFFPGSSMISLSKINSDLKHYFVKWVHNNSYSAENRKLWKIGTNMAPYVPYSDVTAQLQADQVSGLHGVTFLIESSVWCWLLWLYEGGKTGSWPSKGAGPTKMPWKQRRSGRADMCRLWTATLCQAAGRRRWTAHGHRSAAAWAEETSLYKSLFTTEWVSDWVIS